MVHATEIVCEVVTRIELVQDHIDYECECECECSTNRESLNVAK